LYLQEDEFGGDDFLEEPMEVGILFLFHLKPSIILTLRPLNQASAPCQCRASLQVVEVDGSAVQEGTDDREGSEVSHTCYSTIRVQSALWQALTREAA
jgi:hypothetical protein